MKKLVKAKDLEEREIKRLEAEKERCYVLKESEPITFAGLLSDEALQKLKELK